MYCDENGNEMCSMGGTTTTTSSSAAAPAADGGNTIAMLNHLMNVKDSRWLQLEVCREFQRGQCSRTDLDCKFAHPPPHVEVQNGKVTACYDSIKGRCTRDNPKCKYLHPPQHLKDQLLINGRNNLALKNMLVQQIANPTLASAANTNLLAAQQAAVVQQQFGMVAPSFPYGVATSYAQAPQMYNPMAINNEQLQSQLNAMQHQQQQQQQAQQQQQQAQQPAQSPTGLVKRQDRVEICRQFLRGICQRVESECKFAHPSSEVRREGDGTVIVCAEGGTAGCACVSGANCTFYHPPKHIQMKPERTAQMIGPMGGPPTYGGLADVNGNAAAHMMTLQQRINAHLAAPQTGVEPSTSSIVDGAATSAMLGKKRTHEGGQEAIASKQQAAAIAYQQQMMGYQASMAPYGGDDPQAMSAPLLAAYQQQQLAAAALLQLQQQQQQIIAAKRPAFDSKQGIPVYQPAMYAAPFTPFMPQMALPQQFNPYLPQSATTNGTDYLLAAQQQQQTALLLEQQQQQLVRYATNIASVAYFDESGKLLDNLPVCRDFKQGHCDRSACRYVHLVEDYVDVTEGKVTVCRDAAKGKCVRPQCKYYHIPTLSADPMANITSISM